MTIIEIDLDPLSHRIPFYDNYYLFILRMTCSCLYAVIPLDFKAIETFFFCKKVFPKSQLSITSLYPSAKNIFDQNFIALQASTNSCMITF